MKRPLLFKFLTIGLLMLLLLIPIGMIGSSIDERQAYSESVVRDIARSSSYNQTLVGPILVVPYTKTERYWTSNAQLQRVLEERQVYGELHFLPDLLRLNGTLTTELRQRGIYNARLYHANTRVEGEFSIPTHWGIEENFADYQFAQAYLAVGISDIRGIESAVTLVWNGQALDAAPGTQMKMLGNGVHIDLPEGAISPHPEGSQSPKIPFSLALVLQGTGQLEIAPVGKETQVNLQSDWPHPSFIGDFLPVERSVSDLGFSARWQTSFFSTNMAEIFGLCFKSNECNAYEQLRFGVNLIDPVNQYVKSDRAIKYALLFIALTFAGFFLFEVLKRLQVHPVQYGLVGLALAFFYLLLLSLSEHVGFGIAYFISASACVSLIGFYVYYVLHSVGRALGFISGLVSLYGLLYGLLSAEDYALLMGSLLLFIVLSVFMTLTRKVNWYAISQAKSLEERG